MAVQMAIEMGRLINFIQRGIMPKGVPVISVSKISGAVRILPKMVDTWRPTDSPTIGALSLIHI